MLDKALGRVVRLLLSSSFFNDDMRHEGRDGGREASRKKKLSDDLTEQEKSGICWHVRKTEAVRRFPCRVSSPPLESRFQRV